MCVGRNKLVNCDSAVELSLQALTAFAADISGGAVVKVP